MRDALMIVYNACREHTAQQRFREAIADCTAVVRTLFELPPSIQAHVVLDLHSADRSKFQRLKLIPISKDKRLVETEIVTTHPGRKHMRVLELSAKKIIALTYATEGEERMRALAALDHFMVTTDMIWTRRLKPCKSDEVCMRLLLRLEEHCMRVAIGASPLPTEADLEEFVNFADRLCTKTAA